MSTPLPIRPKQTKLVATGELRSTLDFIGNLAGKAHSLGKGRAEVLLQLLEVAREATSRLNGVIAVEGGNAEVRGFVEETIPLQHDWPILFNQMEDLRRYERLRIGYFATPSRNPKKRSGNTVFSNYALALILKIRALRAEGLLHLGSTPSRATPALEQRIHNYIDLCKMWNSSDPSAAHYLAISKLRPTSLAAFGALPEFSKRTAQEWRSTALNVLSQAIPRINEITELASQINDGDVVSEGQIRARITQRIGRAVVALAP